MDRLDEGSSVKCLKCLHKQLQALVVVLTVVPSPADVQNMLGGLAATAAEAEPVLAEKDPEILGYLSSAFAHARHGRIDDLRADLLDASRCATAIMKACGCGKTEAAALEGVVVDE
ncbi:hypothetical protein AB0N89_03875 [Amycolatopsis sp. NPDC089917]|uniref:hypothetical protein n=1 Tax=Amycolatopsis sp. NPDC089917 TaxID=3155187 RepID=UPI003428299C